MIELLYDGFLGKNFFNTVNIFTGIFRGEDALDPTGAGDELCGSAAARCQNAAELFHNADVVEVIVPGQCPADIFKSAGLTLFYCLIRHLLMLVKY